MQDEGNSMMTCAWRFRGLGRGMLRAAAVVLFASAAVYAFAAEELRFFRIGTASPAGSYFQVGGMLANVISKPPGARDCDRGGSCGVPGLVAVAQATQGSVDNAVLVASGQIESGLVQADVAQWAFDGVAPGVEGCAVGAAPVQAFKGGALKNLRVIAALFPEHLHLVARADQHIRRFADLKDKRVGMGEAGSGTLAEARLALAAAGLDECDLKPGYQSLTEAATALQDGKLDAFFVMGGYPVPAVMDVASVVKVNLVPIPQVVVQSFKRRFGGFAASEIPRATYPGIDRATQSVSVPALWLVSSETPDALVHDITASLWQESSRRILDGAHPLGRRIQLANALAGLGEVPLHPGAARWYREAGKLAKTP